MILSVLNTLRTDRPKLAPVRVWRAYAMLDEYKGTQPANELTALVALIRRVCGLDARNFVDRTAWYIPGQSWDERL